MAEGGEKEKIKKACICDSDVVHYITRFVKQRDRSHQTREGGLTKVKKFKENET